MIKRTVIAVLVLLILVPVATAWIALHNQSALRWVVARVEIHYPGAFSVGGVQGTLAGPITLTDIQINQAGFDASIQTLNLEWRPRALLARRLSVNRLSAAGVEVHLKPGAQADASRSIRPRLPHLPVAVVISNLEICRLVLHAPALHTPLVIDRATLAANLDNHAWSVRSLQAEGAHVHIQGEGDWQFRHGEQIQARLQWRLTLPQQPAFIGEAQIAGDGQMMQLNASMKEPFRLRLTAGLQHLFTSPAWQGELSFSGLDPQRMRPGWPELQAGGHLTLQGDQQATLVRGDLSAYQQKYGDWRSHVDLRWGDQQLQVRALELARANTATRFSLSGQIGYADGQLLPELHGKWRVLELPLTGMPWLSSPSGQLEIRAKDQQALWSLDGTLADGGSFSGHGEIDLTARHAWRLQARAHDFRVALESFNQGKPLPPMDWQLQAHGDETQTRVDQFTSTWLSGRLQASGHVNHADGQPWQFDVRAQDINPAAIYPRFPGSLALTARVSGRLGKQAAWTFQLTKLEGRLRDHHAQASGTLSHTHGDWQFQNAVASIGVNSLRLNGSYGKQPSFSWKLDAPDLNSLWPDISGKLMSEGQANLGGTSPLLSLTVDGSALHYLDYAIEKIDARVSMLGNAQPGSAGIDAEGVQLGEFKFDTLAVQATGTLGAHTLTAKLTSPYGKALLNGSGALNEAVWQGNFSEVALTPQGAGQWRAVQAWQPKIAALGFSLPEACVAQATARACVQLDWQPGQWQTDAALTGVPVTDLRALLPEGLEYEGAFDSTLHMQSIEGSHTLDVTASLLPGAIHNVINRRRVTMLAYTSGSLKLHSDDKLTTAELAWALTDGGHMDIHSQITHGQQPAISGSIQGEMRQFDLVTALIPEVGGLDGKLKIDLSLSGTPTDPQFNGSASLVDGAVLIPRLGLHVTGVLLNMTGDGEHLRLDGQAHSGKGTLDWQSSAVRKNNIWQAQGKLSGDNFRLTDIPEAQIDVSPSIDFKLDDRDVYLDGTLDVPYAKLRPRDLTNTAQVSPDQVIVGENGEPAPEKWRVHAQVRINMGKDVYLDGFGLTGHIIGGLLAVDDPGHYTTGSGELQIVNGQYAAYGQKLKITRGRLMFNGGPISDPALDIRAIRPPAHPETVLPGTNQQSVGVQVRGSLRDPKVSLFSDPPLPQAQLLTYLLTGQAPASQSQSPLVGAPPTTAGTSLALTGGQLLMQEVGTEVGQHVGIEDVGVQNVSTGPGTSAPAMFLGRYLSPRLYVSYGVGLLQPINTVRIRYTLSTRWMLEAESGSFANSADLIYTIER